MVYLAFNGSRILKERVVDYKISVFPVDESAREDIRETMKAKLKLKVQVDQINLRVITVDRSDPVFAGKGDLDIRMIVWPSSLRDFGRPIDHARVFDEIIKPQVEYFSIRDFFVKLRKASFRELGKLISGEESKLHSSDLTPILMSAKPEFRESLQDFVNSQFTTDGSTIRLTEELDRNIFNSSIKGTSALEAKVTSLFHVLSISEAVLKDDNSKISDCDRILPTDNELKGMDKGLLSRLKNFCVSYTSGKAQLAKENPIMESGSMAQNSPKAWRRIAIALFIFTTFSFLIFQSGKYFLKIMRPSL
jgi:hypothetical protein